MPMGPLPHVWQYQGLCAWMVLGTWHSLPTESTFRGAYGAGALPIPVPPAARALSLPAHQFETDIVSTLSVQNILLRRNRPMSRW